MNEREEEIKLEETKEETNYKEPGIESKNINPKKESVTEKEKVVEGAKKIESEKKGGIRHDHILMGIKLSLLEISHRDIEKIEQKRYALMSEFEGEEALSKFKEFVWERLLEVSTRK